MQIVSHSSDFFTPMPTEIKAHIFCRITRTHYLKPLFNLRLVSKNFKNVLDQTIFPMYHRKLFLDGGRSSRCKAGIVFIMYVYRIDQPYFLERLPKYFNVEDIISPLGYMELDPFSEEPKICYEIFDVLISRNEINFFQLVNSFEIVAKRRDQDRAKNIFLHPNFINDPHIYTDHTFTHLLSLTSQNGLIDIVQILLTDHRFSSLLMIDAQPLIDTIKAKEEKAFRLLIQDPRCIPHLDKIAIYTIENSKIPYLAYLITEKMINPNADDYKLARCITKGYDKTSKFLYDFVEVDTFEKFVDLFCHSSDKVKDVLLRHPKFKAHMKKFIFLIQLSPSIKEHLKDRYRQYQQFLLYQQHLKDRESNS